MKKTIPFSAFGEQQELCFSIDKIRQLELAMGQSIQQIGATGNAGVDFCLKALPLCLAPASEKKYLAKMEKYLEQSGGTINDIAMPIVHALAASGIWGQESAESAMALYYPNVVVSDQADLEKNV